MRKFLVSLALIALLSAPAFAQTVYLQGAQQPGGPLSVPGAPYVHSDGTANISPTSTNSCRNIHTGGAPAMPATASYTAQTPVTTEFYIAEIEVAYPCTATGVAVYNSATISGNVKVGLATAAGVNEATSASTAMSGTTVYQLVPFTAPITLRPGVHYVTVFYDNNTVRPNTWIAGAFGAAKATTQVYSTGFTTITPPTTFTTALGPVASLY
jgi:hypothetical protein